MVEINDRKLIQWAELCSLVRGAESDDQIGFAQSLVASMVSSYLRISTPYDHYSSSITDDLIGILSDFDLSTASYMLGSMYTKLLPEKHRSRLGIFYTPPLLANHLLTLAEIEELDWKSARVIDPACGGGAFLLPMIIRVKRALGHLPSNELLTHIEGHVKGIDIDPFGAWLAQTFVEAELKTDRSAAGRELKTIVSVCDSLEFCESEHESYDLVIGNPPYGKTKLTAEERCKWSRGLYGHANLYGLFSDLGLRLGNPKGILAYITPTSFLGGQYFKALRSLLLDEAVPTSICFVEKRSGVFADALQETVLAVFKKGSKKDKVSVSFIDTNGNGYINVHNGGDHLLPKHAASPWFLPRSKPEVDLVRQIEDLPFRLLDLGYSVSTGPLVWNRHKENISKHRTEESIPLIWAECVDPSASGHFAFKSTKRNHARWYEPERDNSPNIVSDPCVLVQRTTSREQSRRIVAAELPQEFIEEHGGKVTIENHLNMIRPVPGRNCAIRPRTIMALLNTKTVDQIFRCINGSTAVSAYELEAMPLPAPEKVEKFDSVVEQLDLDETEQYVREMYLHVCSSSTARS